MAKEETTRTKAKKLTIILSLFISELLTALRLSSPPKNTRKTVSLFAVKTSNTKSALFRQAIITVFDYSYSQHVARSTNGMPKSTENPE